MKIFSLFIQGIIWYIIVHFGAKYGASDWTIFLFGFTACFIDDSISLWIDKKRGNL